MKWLNFIIIVVVITLINAGSVMGLLSISSLQIRPNLLIAVLAYFAYISERRDVIITSFMVGFMADISGATMGPSLIAFGIVGVSFAAMRDVLLMERRRNRVVTIFLMSVAVMIIADMLTSMKINQHITRPLVTIPLNALYTAIAGAFLWQAMEFISSVLGVKKYDNR